jgi:hypothetical protein
MALTRKVALFAGHQIGAETLGAARLERGHLQLNDVNPVAYMGATLTAIFNGHHSYVIHQITLDAYLIART